MEDWYQVTQDDFNENGGENLLACYKDSPFSTLIGVFPEHNWMLWRFQSAPKGY